MQHHTPLQTVIIGSGLSGLHCAKTLLNEGEKNVLILDKGKRHGGRMSTYMKDGFVWDKGVIDSQFDFLSVLLFL